MYSDGRRVPSLHPKDLPANLDPLTSGY